MIESRERMAYWEYWEYRKWQRICNQPRLTEDGRMITAEAWCKELDLRMKYTKAKGELDWIATTVAEAPSAKKTEDG